MIKKVLIIEEYPIVAELLKQVIFNTGAQIECFTATTGKKGLNFINRHHFEVIIIEINPPDLSGVEFCGIVKLKNSAQKILAVISPAQRMTAERLIQKGVDGIILKTSDLSMIKEAFNAVLTGNFFLDKEVKELIYPNKLIPVQKPALTKRETEILSLISDGLTNQEIARTLYISCSTVDSHRKNILLKFNANNAAMMIKLAVSQGIIS